MSKNDGGPALPYYMENERGSILAEGMTLRDYFAGQALVGLLSREGWDNFGSVEHRSYVTADFMLKERDK